MPNLGALLPPVHVTELEAAGGGGMQKDQALATLLSLLSKSDAVRDPDGLRHAILAREVTMSTGLGYGIAVPHARIPSVERFVLALGVAPDGIPYDAALDDAPVRLVMMIAGPDAEHAEYLRVLAATMRFLKREKGKILSGISPDEVHRLAGEHAI